MKQVTITIDLEDGEAAWLESWKAFHPTTLEPLTLEQKVQVCVFEKWNAEDLKAQHAADADLWDDEQANMHLAPAFNGPKM